MRQRGRKTALAVAQDTGITSQERPEPPVELTPEQRIEWITVVNSVSADWFPPETHGLLTQYCRHVVASRHIAELVSQAESGDEFSVLEYDKLLKMQERESRIIASLLTKMRLSQQSTYHPEKTKGGKKGKGPWSTS